MVELDDENTVVGNIADLSLEGAIEGAIDSVIVDEGAIAPPRPAARPAAMPLGMPPAMPHGMPAPVRPSHPHFQAPMAQMPAPTPFATPMHAAPAPVWNAQPPTRPTPAPPMAPIAYPAPPPQRPSHPPHMMTPPIGHAVPPAGGFNTGLEDGPAQPGADGAMSARLASLTTLSLDKGPQANYTASGGSSSSKLPWVLLVLVVAGGAYYHVTTVNGMQQTQAPAAEAQGSGSAEQPVEHRATGLIASGYIAAKVPIVLSAGVSGRLLELKVDDGAKIVKGQVIALLDDSELKAERALAGAQLRDAQRTENRMSMLEKAQAATAVDLEHAIGAVEVAAAAVRVADQKIDQTKVRSPIDGTVLEVLAHPGESLYVGPSGAAGVVRIADLAQLVAEVDVGDADIKSVYVGQIAEMTTDSLRGKTFHGIVRDVSDQADKARGTILVKVEIQNMAADAAGTGSGSGSGSATPASGSAAEAAEHPLKPGMAVQVNFLPRPEPPKSK